ncbi:uncharacterized protein LOC119683070 [Teleopsis dalmanni]|uniref:uncharacterized protein LOC119683068 n=1 Tax=Teleopsis dalmanni TaxID=139649 RepID=UPI0018CFAE3B|nr:uncharacterized protein LOC119683068 [Teleopsis dalmanni]XP_037952600.1 uncharacterized protein LOC119683070 [Teleopsis dalmanni]
MSSEHNDNYNFDTKFFPQELTEDNVNFLKGILEFGLNPPKRSLNVPVMSEKHYWEMMHEPKKQESSIIKSCFKVVNRFQSSYFINRTTILGKIQVSLIPEELLNDPLIIILGGLWIAVHCF